MNIELQQRIIDAFAHVYPDLTSCDVTETHNVITVHISYEHGVIESYEHDMPADYERCPYYISYRSNCRDDKYLYFTVFDDDNSEDYEYVAVRIRLP